MMVLGFALAVAGFKPAYFWFNHASLIPLLLQRVATERSLLTTSTLLQQVKNKHLLLLQLPT
jgi:hypothetical protein